MFLGRVNSMTIEKCLYQLSSHSLIVSGCSIGIYIPPNLLLSDMA